jgi:hypothetical protein
MRETPRPIVEIENEPVYHEHSAVIVTFHDGTEITVRESTIDFSPVVEIRHPGEAEPTAVDLPTSDTPNTGSTE